MPIIIINNNISLIIINSIPLIIINNITINNITINNITLAGPKEGLVSLAPTSSSRTRNLTLWIMKKGGE